MLNDDTVCGFKSTCRVETSIYQSLPRQGEGDAKVSDDTTTEGDVEETSVSDAAPEAEAVDDVQTEEASAPEASANAADEVPVDRSEVEKSAQWTAWQYARHLNDRFDLDEINAQLEAAGSPPVDLFTWQEVYALSGETRHGEAVTEKNIADFAKTIGPNSPIRKRNVNGHLRDNNDPRFVDDKSTSKGPDASTADGSPPPAEDVFDGLRQQIEERNDGQPSTEVVTTPADADFLASAGEFAEAEVPFDENPDDEPFASITPASINVEAESDPVEPSEASPVEGGTSNYSPAEDLNGILDTYSAEAFSLKAVKDEGDTSSAQTRHRLENHLAKLPRGEAMALLDEILLDTSRWVHENPAKVEGGNPTSWIDRVIWFTTNQLLMRTEGYAEAKAACEGDDEALERMLVNVPKAVSALLYGSKTLDTIFYVVPQLKHEPLVPNTPPPVATKATTSDVPTPVIEPEPAAEPQPSTAIQVADPEPVAQPAASVAQPQPAPEPKPQPKAGNTVRQMPTPVPTPPVELIPSPPVAEVPVEPTPAVTIPESPDTRVITVTVTDEPKAEDDSLNPSEPPEVEDPVEDDTSQSADEDDAELMAQLDDIFSDAKAGVAEMADLGYPVVA